MAKAGDYEKRIDFDDPNDTHAKMIEMVGTDRKVLDFGCSTGFVAAELSRRGCSVTGLEIDPEAARAAEEHCEKVIVADLDSVDLKEELGDEKYEVGLFGDVIEHLKNPVGLLVQTRGVLADGGYIVLSVPNIAHASIRLMLLKGDFDYEDTGILDETHLKYYTRKTIGDLLESSGYVVEVMDWTEQAVAEKDLMDTLDPLGIADLQEVVEAFATWEAVAYQFVIKAFPAGEEERLQKLSEEKVQAERRAKVLERELAECRRGLEGCREDYRRSTEGIDHLQKQLDGLSGELERASTYARELEQRIAEKDEYLSRLESSEREQRDIVEEKTRRIEELRAEVERLDSGPPGGKKKPFRRG